MNSKELWINLMNLKPEGVKEQLPLALNNGYSGIMLKISQIELIKQIPQNISVIIMMDENNKKDLLKISKEYPNRIIALIKDPELKTDEYPTIRWGSYVEVYDKESMNNAIELSNRFEVCVIEFKSETNIPLELVLAFSQKNKCKVCKQVQSADDGWIATMTMEMGSYSVLLNTKNIDEIPKLKMKLDKFMEKKINIQKLKVKSVEHIGMGDRVCIDTTSLLKEDEGMIIGSTSSGGILVSSETHFLPYMDLRPFRVNAGALHSYVLAENNTTKYLSELKAGDKLLAVDSEGNTRVVAVGRVKMERRPLLLIKVTDSSNKEINVIVQDDWHIRIISENGKVKNSTLLKEGDIVLGYTMKAGRHLGVQINETIVEK